MPNGRLIRSTFACVDGSKMHSHWLYGEVSKASKHHTFAHRFRLFSHTPRQSTVATYFWGDFPLCISLPDTKFMCLWPLCTCIVCSCVLNVRQVQSIFRFYRSVPLFYLVRTCAKAEKKTGVVQQAKKEKERKENIAIIHI